MTGKCLEQDVQVIVYPRDEAREGLRSPSWSSALDSGEAQIFKEPTHVWYFLRAYGRQFWYPRWWSQYRVCFKSSCRKFAGFDLICCAMDCSVSSRRWKLHIKQGIRSRGVVKDRSRLKRGRICLWKKEGRRTRKVERTSYGGLARNKRAKEETKSCLQVNLRRMKLILGRFEVQNREIVRGWSWDKVTVPEVGLKWSGWRLDGKLFRQRSKLKVILRRSTETPENNSDCFPIPYIQWHISRIALSCSCQTVIERAELQKKLEISEKGLNDLNAFTARFGEHSHWGSKEIEEQRKDRGHGLYQLDKTIELPKLFESRFMSEGEGWVPNAPLLIISCDNQRHQSSFLLHAFLLRYQGVFMDHFQVPTTSKSIKFGEF